MFLRVASSWVKLSTVLVVVAFSAWFGVSDFLDRMGRMGRIKTGYRDFRELFGVDVRAENACVQKIHPVHPPHPFHPVEKIPIRPGS